MCCRTARESFGTWTHWRNLLEVVGNPFTDSSKDLLELAASDIMDSGVISSVRHIENLGPQQCEAYLQDRPYKPSNLYCQHYQEKQYFPLQSIASPWEISLWRITVLSTLDFIKMFQKKCGNIDELFAHENHAYPPSLSQTGVMRSGTKSDLVSCLEGMLPNTDNAPNPTTEVVIIDIDTCHR